jgi:polysaccharide export outer membrane protein
MRNRAWTAALLLLAPFSLAVTCESPTATFDYNALRDRCRGSFRLESGDVVRVNVWNEPNHSRDEVLVRPDGKISLPLLEDIQAAGLTVSELSLVVKRKVQTYVPSPRVDVSLVRARSYQVYVMGEVRRAGAITAQSPINVVQALSLAGGLTAYAKEDSIVVLWKSPRGDVRIPFSYGEMVKGVTPEQNITLCRGDIILVP